MKLLPVLLILVLLIACQPAAGLEGLVPIPPNTQAPSDPDSDGKYEDLNGNNRMDFADVVLYFTQMSWITANEPIAAFDFNGNGRIDFADVVSLFNELGSSPTPTPTAGVIISGTVAPSDQDQVLRGGGINLTIPGGALNQTSSVRLATVSSPPPPPEGTSNLTVYDVTVGTQVRFFPGLAIEIPYTPAMIPPGKSPARVLQGIRWDDETGMWREIPTAVDTARGVVVLETDHLCVAGYTAKLTPAPATEIYSSPFVIHFDPSDDAAIAAAWKDSGNLTTANELAYYVKYALDDAYDLYVRNNGFKKPVPSRFSLDNQVHVYVGDYYESEWHQFTKTITVSREPFLRGSGALDRLREEMRHELFHAVQNAYVGTFWMNSNRWWTEATAEYASTGLYDGITSPSFPLDAAFFTSPLTTANGYHEYQAAHFVEALDERGGDFRSVWEATISDTNACTAIQGWCEERGSSLGAVYEDLMAHSQLLELTWVGGWGSYLVRPSILGGARDLAETNVIPWFLYDRTGTVSAAFRVSTTEDSVTLFETLQSGESTLPHDCHVTRYHVWPSGSHKTDHFPYGAESDSFDPSAYEARDGDVIVYTIASGFYPFSDAIILTTPEARIEPEFKEVVAGNVVAFTVSIENVPSSVPVQVVDGYNDKVLATGTGSASLSFSRMFPDPGSYPLKYRAKTKDGRWSSEDLTSFVVVKESI